MKSKLFFFLLPVAVLSSCNNDESISANRSLLTKHVWKKKYYEQISYLEDGSSVIISHDDTNAETEFLSFDKNQNVVYANPEFTNQIEGNWDFDDNEIYLYTDLRHETPGTGTEIHYYFTQSKIGQLTENDLILISDTTYWHHSSGNTKNISKYHFRH